MSGARASRSPSREPPDALERAVLALVARGYTHAQIGDRLHYHEGTIGRLVADLARRHGVTTRQLLVLAGERGWASVGNGTP